MRIIVLGVDVPNHGSRRPLRTYKRILPADDADVGSPKEFVETLLRHVGQRAQGEASAHCGLPHEQFHVKPVVDRTQNRTRADPQHCRPIVCGEALEPRLQPVARIAEQQYGEGMLRWRWEVQ